MRQKAPAATSVHVRRQMQQLAAGRDTRPERALRQELWRRGVRGYRIDRRLPLEGVRRRADITFVGRRIAVFVDGCFWHNCPAHGRSPKSNSDYWTAKLARNVEKDRETDRLAAESGWQVIRIWEHEDVHAAASLVEAAVQSADLASA